MATFNESTAPGIGIDTSRSHRSRVRRRQAAPLGAEHQHHRPVGDLELEHRRGALGREPHRPDLAPHGARSSAPGMPLTTATGTCSTAPAAAFTAAGVSGAARWTRDHHTGRTGGAGDAQDRAEVAGVGHAVERDEERSGTPSSPSKSAGAIGSARASTPWGASVRASAMRRARSTWRTRTRSRRGEPFERIQPAVVLAPGRDPDAAHAAPAGREQRLDGTDPLDLLAAEAGAGLAGAHARCHTVPLGVSSRTMPRAVSSSRIASAPAKSRARAMLLAPNDQRVDLGIRHGSPDPPASSSSPTRTRERDHGRHQGPRAVEVTVVERLVRRAHGVEDHRHRLAGSRSRRPSRRGRTRRRSVRVGTDASTPAARARRASASSRFDRGRGSGEIVVAELDGLAVVRLQARPCGTRAARARRARRTAW